jgi:hypothetical protein
MSWWWPTHDARGWPFPQVEAAVRSPPRVVFLSVGSTIVPAPSKCNGTPWRPAVLL